MDYLFEHLGKIEKRIKNRCILLFLDFDGTLAPIAPTPDKAILPEETRKILKALAGSTKCKLAFISGRSLADIKKKVGLKGVIYSGNHGLEIEGPGIKFESLVSQRYKLAKERIKERLNLQLADFKGSFVEDKGLTLSLHYRLLDEKLVPGLKAIFKTAVSEYALNRRIKVCPGKMVIEVRPAVNWGKGKVALWLLARQRFISEKKKFLPVYLGDDISDEDAFKALRKSGLTLLVGKNRQSYAEYYLRGPKEVVVFLKKILENKWQI